LEEGYALENEAILKEGELLAVNEHLRSQKESLAGMWREGEGGRRREGEGGWREGGREGGRREKGDVWREKGRDTPLRTRPS
jgi:hypothetical protein